MSINIALFVGIFIAGGNLFMGSIAADDFKCLGATSKCYKVGNRKDEQIN
jgi:hypothetical protein